jgi:hypothetical protein
MVGTDPKQAVAQARNLVAADPGNAQLQGIYLAALYRSRNSWDFERGLSKAMASGVTVKKMMDACPAFRGCLAEESRAHKAKPPSGILSDEVMQKILASL